MNNIYFGIGAAILVYLCYLLLIICNKRRLDKYIRNGKECNLIKGKFKINFDKVNHKLVANLFAIDNALIIGITIIILMSIDNFLLMLLLGFLMFTFSILITYLLIGKFIKSKEAK